MSTDLSPLGRIEPPPPAATRAEGQTLTLQLRFRDGADAMSGALTLRTLPVASANMQRASVVAVDPAPLTITFQ